MTNLQPESGPGPVRNTSLLALTQIRRQQHLGGHTRNQRAVRIVDLQLQADGLDVALAPADIALRCEVALHRLEDQRAVDGIALRQTNFQAIAHANVAALGFRRLRAYPGVVEVEDGNDRRTGIDDFTLPRGTHRNRSTHWCVDF